MNWAKKNQCQLTAPKIERPDLGEPQKLDMNVSDVEDKDGTGRGAWLNYAVTRAAWTQSLFAKNYPMEAQYRHTLQEEVAALNAVADAVERQKAAHLDPQLTNVLMLKRDHLLEAWILLNGSDAGVAQDYASYRAAHHAELRAYFDKYIIHSLAPDNPNN